MQTCPDPDRRVASLAQGPRGRELRSPRVVGGRVTAHHAIEWNLRYFAGDAMISSEPNGTIDRYAFAPYHGGHRRTEEKELRRDYHRVP